MAFHKTLIGALVLFSAVLFGTSTVYQVFAAVLHTPPPPPQSQYITAIPSTSCGLKVSVSWRAVNGATGYIVYRSSVSSRDFREILTINSTGTTTHIYTDTVTSATSTYYYKLAAFNTAGISVPSTAVSSKASGICVATTTPPSAPATLRAITSSSCGGKVDLSWIGSSGASSYNIYRNDLLIKGNAVVNSLTDNGTPATSYSYRVSALSSGGSESAKTAAVTVRMSDICIDPNPPIEPPDFSPPPIDNRRHDGFNFLDLPPDSLSTATSNIADVIYERENNPKPLSAAAIQTTQSSSYKDTPDFGTHSKKYKGPGVAPWRLFRVSVGQKDSKGVITSEVKDVNLFFNYQASKDNVKDALIKVPLNINGYWDTTHIYLYPAGRNPQKKEPVLAPAPTAVPVTINLDGEWYRVYAQKEGYTEKVNPKDVLFATPQLFPFKIGEVNMNDVNKIPFSGKVEDAMKAFWRLKTIKSSFNISTISTTYYEVGKKYLTTTVSGGVGESLLGRGSKSPTTTLTPRDFFGQYDLSFTKERYGIVSVDYFNHLAEDDGKTGEGINCSDVSSMTGTGIFNYRMDLLNTIMKKGDTYFPYFSIFYQGSGTARKYVNTGDACGSDITTGGNLASLDPSSTAQKVTVNLFKTPVVFNAGFGNSPLADDQTTIIATADAVNYFDYSNMYDEKTGELNKECPHTPGIRVSFINKIKNTFTGVLARIAGLANTASLHLASVTGWKAPVPHFLTAAVSSSGPCRTIFDPISKPVADGTESGNRSYLAYYLTGILLQPTNVVNKQRNNGDRVHGTELDTLTEETLSKLIALKLESNAMVQVTGGTEPGHSNHGKGKQIVDLKWVSLNNDIHKYVSSKAVKTRRIPGFGDAYYIHGPAEGIYVDEFSAEDRHWHVVLGKDEIKRYLKDWQLE
jgi:hypothetical protein